MIRQLKTAVSVGTVLDIRNLRNAHHSRLLNMRLIILNGFKFQLLLVKIGQILHLQEASELPHQMQRESVCLNMVIQDTEHLSKKENTAILLYSVKN